MKLKLIGLTCVLVISLLLCCVASNAQTPDASRIWMRSNGSTTQPLWFGNRTGNTTAGGLDTAQSFPVEDRESEAPPPPPTGFDAVWAPVRANQFGTGIGRVLGTQINAVSGDPAQK